MLPPPMMLPPPEQQRARPLASASGLAEAVPKFPPQLPSVLSDSSRAGARDNPRLAVVERRLAATRAANALLVPTSTGARAAVRLPSEQFVCRAVADAHSRAPLSGLNTAVPPLALHGLRD
eukprot:4764289-Prymnesium_polylepis.1